MKDVSAKTTPNSTSTIANVPVITLNTANKIKTAAKIKRNVLSAELIFCFMV